MTDSPALPAVNREWHLVTRPVGWPKPEDFALVEAEVPTPGDGQVLVRNLYVSVDPYMRGRMSAAKSYAAPYELGKPMLGGAVGEVVASNAEGIASGTTSCTSSAGASTPPWTRRAPSRWTRTRRPCRRTWACSA